jgi:hypothetical protein
MVRITGKQCVSSVTGRGAGTGGRTTGNPAAGSASTTPVTDPDKVATGELVGIVGRAVSLEHRRGLRASLCSFYRWALAVKPGCGAPRWRACTATTCSPGSMARR